MRQQLQQESEALFSGQVHNRQVEPEVERADTSRSEELSRQSDAQQTAELNVTLTRQVVEQRECLRRIIGAGLGFVIVMAPITMRVVSPLQEPIPHQVGEDAIWRTFLQYSAPMLGRRLDYSDTNWRAFLLSPLWLITNLLAVCSFAGYVIFIDTHRRRKARKAVDALRTVADIKSVGPLTDALRMNDLPARRDAQDMLIELLPRLQPEDSGLLNAAQRANLCSVLNVPVESALYKNMAAVFKPADHREVEIRVAILHALTRIGDEQALPIMAHLAETQARTDGERRIQETARICLPLLHERVEQLRDPHTLLRASSAEFTNPEVLLRPATQSGETSTDQLLRAATPES
jgi:hypothetical protein